MDGDPIGPYHAAMAPATLDLVIHDGTRPARGAGAGRGRP